MERSGNFYKAIRLGYILISILIGCMAYNSLYEWQEIEALELGNKKIDELRKEINNINIQMIKFSLLGETILERNLFSRVATIILPGLSGCVWAPVSFMGQADTLCIHFPLPAKETAKKEKSFENP